MYSFVCTMVYEFHCTISGPDQKIMNELLIHEGRLGGVAGLSGVGAPSGTVGVRGDQYTTYSSSSEEEEEEEEEKRWAGSQPNPDQSAEESSDEEFTMKVKCTVMNDIHVHTFIMHKS